MTRAPGDTVHTVRIQNPPSTTLRFVVGVCTLYALWSQRQLIAGFIFRASMQTEADGMESVTGIVLPIAIDFVIALGGFVIFAGSFGYSILADVAAGVFATIGNWATRAQLTARVRDAMAAAADVATAAAGSVAGTVAGTMGTGSSIAAATQAAVMVEPQSGTQAAWYPEDAQANRDRANAVPKMALPDFMAAVQMTLREHRDAIRAIADQLDETKPGAGGTSPPKEPPRRGRPKSTGGAS